MKVQHLCSMCSAVHSRASSTDLTPRERGPCAWSQGFLLFNTDSAASFFSSVFSFYQSCGSTWLLNMPKREWQVVREALTIVMILAFEASAHLSRSWRWKRRMKKVGLKLNIQKTKIMVPGPITSWQIDEEKMKTMTDYFLRLQNHCGWWLQPWN